MWRLSHPGSVLTASDFETAYRQYHTPLFNYALRMLGDRDAAYDASLVTFERALKSWDRLDPELGVKAWLFRVATNVCLDELRRRKRFSFHTWERLVAAFQPARDTPEQEVIGEESAAAVRRAMQKLPEHYRAALLMKECEQFSCAQIADVLGITEAGAKVLLYRARRRLREAYVATGDSYEG